MRLVKTVFHLHTDYSPDSNVSPESVIDDALRAGVHCVTITDHNTLAGARRVAYIARDCDLKVVVGEEISTADGHLIGLFLCEPVEPGLPLRRTAELIREQGGLVVVPHPFNRIFDCGLRGKVYDILDLIDIVEVHNAQNALPFPNMLAGRFAARHGYPALVGADTHLRGHLAPSYQWMPAFDGPRQFVESLAQASLVRGRHSVRYFLSATCRLVRGAVGLPISADFGRNHSSRRGVELEAAATFS
jgi:hypothetical protein